MGNDERGKLLQFNQPANFFLKRGADKHEKNNLVDAIAYYRRALAGDKYNVEYKLALAEALTQIGRFELSNEVLYSTFNAKLETASECYFALGCNYIALNMLQEAHAQLTKYLLLDPEGEFADDAFDMMCAVEEEFERLGKKSDPFQSDDYDDDDDYDREVTITQADIDDLRMAAIEAQQKMEQRDYGDAIKVLRAAYEKAPELGGQRNNLIMALYLDGKYGEATKLIEETLSQNPSNVQALCQRLMLCAVGGDDEATDAAVEALVKCDTRDADDLGKIACTLMQLGLFAKAKIVQQRALLIEPYDEASIHRFGVCEYFLGNYDSAFVTYDKMLRVDPFDLIGRYYRKLCSDAICGTPSADILHINMFEYDLPESQCSALDDQLEQILSSTDEENKQSWNEDAMVRTLLKWALYDESKVERVMYVLAKCGGDDDAESILRGYILSQDAPDDHKRLACLLLSRMGVAGPYVMYMGGILVNSRESLVKELPEDAPGPYVQVELAAMAALSDCKNEAAAFGAAQLWLNYTIAFDHAYPPIPKQQMQAAVAALDYLARRTIDRSITKADIAEKHKLSVLRLTRAIDRIRIMIKTGDYPEG